MVLLGLLAYPLYYRLSPPQVYEVQGKCAVVTGASAGLGVTIAQLLAEEGVKKLIIAARSKDKLDAVAANITKSYPKTEVLSVRSDVASDEDNAQLAQVAAENFGTCPTILVNNAGVETFLHFEKASKTAIDRMIDINFRGLVHLTHDFMPLLMKSGGHVVNIASVAGRAHAINLNVYGATKAAVHVFSMDLRTDTVFKKHPFTVHSILPGFVKDAGMAADMEKQTGKSLSDITLLFGASYPIDTARAVVNAIKFDEPEIIVNFPPMEPLLMLQLWFPRFFGFLFTISTPPIDKAWEFLDATANLQTF